MRVKKLLEEEEYSYEEVERPRARRVEPEIEVCSRDEMGVLLASLLNEITKAFAIGVRFIINVEPILYESALSLLTKIAGCAPYWASEFVITDEKGNQYTLSFSLYQTAKPREGEIKVAIMTERTQEKLISDIEVVAMRPRLLYMMMVPKPPEVTITSALYKTNLVQEIVRKTLKVLDMKYGSETDEFRRKLEYVGRVPYETLLFMSLKHVENTARVWMPPPPPNSGYLRKRERSLDELVIPESLRTLIKKYIEVIRYEGRGSLLLVGLPASGRKTIAQAIARELNLPAYVLSVANLLSRWVGESEGKMREFFTGLRSTGGLAVFENVEVLFRKVTSDSVTPNLRSILYQEMARDDNNFVMVFTSIEDAPPEVFDSPLIGELKLVVPPPNEEERKQLARMFLVEIAGDKWPKLVEIAGKTVGGNEGERLLYSMYADVFAGAGVGLTSGELYRVMKAILIPAFKRIIEEGRLVSISEDIETMMRREYTQRQARLSMLRRRALYLGLTDIADAIVKVEAEVRREAIRVMKELEKYQDL